MKVIFLKDVPGTAAGGDVKEVARGFARNYLFPRNLATHVTPNALQHVERGKAAAARQVTRAREGSEALAAQLSSAYVTLAAKVGDEGRLFGAITTQDVADALKIQYGIELDKRKISFHDPIKTAGSWVADVKLDHGVSASINLNVEAE